MIRLFALVLALVAALPCAARAAGEPAGAPGAASAVVVMYHRFGEDAYPTTNIRLAQFDQHLAHLRSGGYAVLPLEAIAQAMLDGQPLPARAVGISVDDATRSFFTQAWPRLRALGLPVTLFVATDALDGGYGGYLGWAELRAMVREGLSVGHHGAAHPHMAGFDRAAAAAEIARASARFMAELGQVPRLFAYPYGEIGEGTEAAVREAGFLAAFGQHSGVLHPGSDRWFLPRFALNEHYGTAERFRRVVETLALPLGDMEPKNRVLGGANPPRVSLRPDAALLPDLTRLRCYASHMEGVALPIVRAGDRIEVRIERPFPRGRSRLNCTLPGPQGRFRWFGEQFLVP